MTREEAIDIIKCLAWHTRPNEEDIEQAIKALEQEPCDDVISRQAVEDKLLKLCNELEGIFANIRMQNQDESVCGLCEYDCPAPYECPGFDVEDCFKLADEIRHKWQSTKELPPVTPQPKTGHWIADEVQLPDRVVLNYHCSVCGRKLVGYSTETLKDAPYCHCGAKMESEDKE